MAEITEKRSEDKRGYVVRLYKDDVEFAHYIFTKKGFARGGSSYPYEKDVTICFGELLEIGCRYASGLPPFSKKFVAGKSFHIHARVPTLIVALEDNFGFAYHKGAGEGKRDANLEKIKDKINSGENLEAVLKEFGIIDRS